MDKEGKIKYDQTKMRQILLYKHAVINRTTLKKIVCLRMYDEMMTNEVGNMD